MSVLVKNGNDQIQKFYSQGDGSKASKKFKMGILKNLKLDAPLVCWPKDKESLIALINLELAQADLRTLSDIDDVAEKKKKKAKHKAETTSSENPEEEVMEVEVEDLPEIEYLDEKEYIDIPDEVYDVEGCSEKVLGIVVRLLNHRTKVLRKIRKMKSLRATPEQVGEEIEKVVIYNIALAKYLPLLNTFDSLEVLNVKSATKLFEDVCTEGYEEIPSQAGIETEIRKNKEDQDFDIVAALAYVGLNVDKDDYGHYSIKGINDNGIKYFLGQQEKTFSLSKESCHRFVDEFLNKPIENRKFITPGQVFISYINEAENSLGLNTRSAVELNEIFGTMANSKSAKAYFRDVIKKYSRNAQEWKDFQKLFASDYYANKETKDDMVNKLHIKQQAKRLVIGEMFEEFLNGNLLLTQEQVETNDYRASDISRDFGLNIDLSQAGVKRVKIEKLEDQAFRLVNTLHGTLQELRAFVQDIIDNYTVDYLRKEKIFLLQQDDQKEYIEKKKSYEDLIERVSIDKGKDGAQQVAYYQSQVDELTQKIGNNEYKEAKNILLKSKNNYRVLLLNAKAQKENIKMNIDKAEDKAKEEGRRLTVSEKVEIIRKTLSATPELIVTFDRGKVVSWTKHKEGDNFDKKIDKLSDVDKIIEKTASKISNESHQKIMEENKIREAVKKSQKEERVKSVNAYINAYGSIVGSASGVGAYNGIPVTGYPQGYMPQPPMGGPTFGVLNQPYPPYPYPPYPYPPQGYQQPAPQPTSSAPAKNNYPQVQGGLVGPGNSQPAPQPSAPVSQVSSNPSPVSQGNATPATTSAGSNGGQGNVSGGSSAPNFTSGVNGGAIAPAPAIVNPTPIVVQTPSPVAMAMSGMGVNQPTMKDDYQNFDFISESVEPNVIPYIVGYEKNGVTIYGNAMEDYATYDRYKFLLTTNNNALYDYMELKKSQIQTPEQIINDLHIRYIKNAMSKSGFATLDSNLVKFDHTGDVRKFLAQYVPQNIIDIVVDDYNELISTIDFDLMKELVDHRFANDLEDYIPDRIKDGVNMSAVMIATVVKSIMTDKSVKSTYEAYSSKMKQSYINSLIEKIEKGEIPKVSLNTEETYERMTDYLSFSIKGQNVIIQESDEKDNGFDTYPRGIFFRQKNSADIRLKNGKNLSFEQNEMITTNNQPDLTNGGKVVNLFGILYKFNGAFNKLLIKLKPNALKSGVKFMENILDAIRQTIDVKATVLVDETKKVTTNLVKFASKDKKKEVSTDDATYDYDSEKWFVRRGFVLDKIKVKEYYFLLAFGFKYALEQDKASLKEDFYQDNILALNKINEKFKDFPEDTVSLITAVIRSVMMSKCERVVDYISYINNQFNGHFNKVLYINQTIWESRSFDKKTKEEKSDTLDSLEFDYNVKSEDIANPHPEIYAPLEDLERYEVLYMYYAMFELFEKLEKDDRIVCPQLSDYFYEYKKKLRSQLLAKIRDKVELNGYEKEIAKYFELNLEKVVDLHDFEGYLESDNEEDEAKERIRIQNIDVIFRGIQEGFNKAIKNEDNATILNEMEEVGKLLNYIGDLPNRKNPEKDLEIALPNNQVIICNIKGFVQQYLFRYIVDKEHELGPFAYVVSELCQHEELVDVVKNIEIVADRLNNAELGINLFACFSSITHTKNGHIFKVGDNISTVLETINRLKTPTDMQKALNRDIFYKEGVLAVQRCFEDYFNRRKLEEMK